MISIVRVGRHVHEVELYRESSLRHSTGEIFDMEADEASDDHAVRELIIRTAKPGAAGHIRGIGEMKLSTITPDARFVQANFDGGRPVGEQALGCSLDSKSDVDAARTRDKDQAVDARAGDGV